MKKLSTITLFSLILLGCASNNNSVAQSSTNSNYQSSTSKIYNNIKSRNLDDADSAYIDLKTNSESPTTLSSVAKTLAIVHMQNQEYILANFYLQQALQVDGSDEFTKFLLSKNQFLSALKNQRDQSYRDRALKALEVDRNLVADEDYSLLANSMLTRVKLDTAWNNKEIGNTYKRLNKQEASQIYENRIKSLGFDINDIYKP